MNQLKSLQAYEYIAFLTGFALMAYELVASRILAPSIGSSIYVWTSIIGVIIAALSIGYKVGGKLADSRADPLDISRLLMACAVAVLLTLLGAQTVLAVVTSISADPRLQGFMASLWLFAPTSFLIGMISPYLARLKNISVKTTGSTIASLSALNAMGSVTGTFVTGFIFFAYIGSQESLLLVSAVLFGSSWLIEPKQLLKQRLKAVLLLIVLALLSFISTKNPSVVAFIDTPSASYRIIDVDYKGKTVRAITAGPGGLQSGVYLDGSKELTFSYTQKMAELVEQSLKKDKILVLGGGAFTLPQYLADKYPSSRIDVVEIDPQLVSIARQYFGYKDPPNVSVISQDARVFLNGNNQKYDVVLVDVYSDTLIPFSLSTMEYAKRLKLAVNEEGLVIANIIGSSNPACKGLLEALHTSYARQFSFYKAYPLGDPSLQTTQNIIVAYSLQKLEWLPEPVVPVELSKGRILTDNFAPVEYLKQQCRAGV